MENLEIKEHKWTTLGRISNVLYRDKENTVVLLDNQNEYILLFIVADPRLNNELPLVAFASEKEATLFFRTWKTHALKDIHKAQKQQKISEQ